MMPPVTPPVSQMTPLARKLAAKVAADGPMTLHDYMEACLYDPAYGYYKKREALGRGGDFITAPEISQVFGELIGLWAGETWRIMGEPRAVRLIELGPGRGVLMADALRALRVLPAFLQCATVHLVETSAPMRASQEAALAGAPCPVFWHDRIEDAPDGPAIVIANEFFDCLPVRQHVFDEVEGLWRERLVAFEDGAFKFAQSEAGVNGLALKRDLPSVEDGAIVETCPSAGSVLRSRAANPLAALIIDYGYAQPAYGDTVQAVSRHRFAGLFDAPGEADLTAHVDFSALSQHAAELGLSASGPMPMGEWLLRLGLEARVNQLMRRATPEQAAELQSRVTRLVDPAQMGALFKVLVLTGGLAEALPPF
jgi:NADH dehydrogenase [ubiquinone] 1 alpha subcomplex assembly factor 7